MTTQDLTSRPVRRFETSKGDVVETYPTDREALQVLGRNDLALSGFGRSLLDQGVTRGLSERQIPWLHKLALEYVPAHCRPGQPAPAPALVLDLAPVRTMMDRAAEHLQYPKIRFALEEGTLELYRAGDRSSAPGSLTVTSGGAYGTSTYFGRVHTDGRWQPARGGAPAWVEQALRELAADPAAFAGAYGRRTGQCCFCRRGLTDARSVAVGYGPTCADKWGMPWGEEVAAPGAPMLEEEDDGALVPDAWVQAKHGSRNAA